MELRLSYVLRAPFKGNFSVELSIPSTRLRCSLGWKIGSDYRCKRVSQTQAEYGARGSTHSWNNPNKMSNKKEEFRCEIDSHFLETPIYTEIGKQHDEKYVYQVCFPTFRRVSLGNERIQVPW